MNISIKNYLSTKGVKGDIILYRDSCHKKKAMCEYIAEQIKTVKNICVYSGGAFGLYMSKAFPQKSVFIFGKVTSEYKTQIERLPNATIFEGTNNDAKQYASKNDCLFVDQFAEPLIREYYKKHFVEILAEVGTIDAFVDCGHSCATLAGAIESGANLQFVLGINRVGGERQNVHYLKDHKGKFTQETTRNFDTAVLQTEIEDAYPSFGNIFEATRSISAAMSWLQKNPNKTVLVYVGDSPVFGEDATL